MVADAVLADARFVPDRFSEPLERVRAIADDACRSFGKLHPDVSAEADDAALMKTGLLWMEPALKRFIYRDLQESSVLQPHFGLCYFTDSFAWQGGDDISFEDTALKVFPAEVVQVKHALALWVELCRRLG